MRNPPACRVPASGGATRTLTQCPPQEETHPSERARRGAACCARLGYDRLRCARLGYDRRRYDRLRCDRLGRARLGRARLWRRRIPPNEPVGALLAAPVCAAPVCAAPVCAATVWAAPVCAAPVWAAPVWAAPNLFVPARRHPRPGAGWVGQITWGGVWTCPASHAADFRLRSRNGHPHAFLTLPVGAQNDQTPGSRFSVRRPACRQAGSQF